MTIHAVQSSLEQRASIVDFTVYSLLYRYNDKSLTGLLAMTIFTSNLSSMMQKVEMFFYNNLTYKMCKFNDKQWSHFGLTEQNNESISLKITCITIAFSRNFLLIVA